MSSKASDIEINLKNLQDLKFLIFKYTNYKLDFYMFNILTIDLPTQTIDLASIYSKLFKEKSLEEIAHYVISEYKLA